MKELKIPGFKQMWDSFIKYSDESWIITAYTLFDKKNIINYLSSEKKLLAFGDGFTTKIPIDNEEIRNIYIKKTPYNSRFQKIPSFEYSYYYGFDEKSKYFRTDRRNLYLNASSSTVAINITDESIKRLGYFSLFGNNYSYLSKDETIQELYFNQIDGKTRLINGVDFEYFLSEKSIHVLAQSFYRNQTILLGTGDGIKRVFPFRTMGRIMYIYVNNRKDTSYSVDRDTITFSSPPQYGAEIRAFFDPPRLLIRKSPPNDTTGIFIDKIDEAVVLDFDQIQNYPRQNVIFAYSPLLIRGTCRMPLVIISKESIYIENLNPNLDGEPVMMIAQKGVWLYRRAGQIENKVNKAVIISPLNALYNIFETGEFQNPAVNIYGSTVLTFENPDGIMNQDGLFEKNFFYFEGLKKYLQVKPFSLFPYPLEIINIRRN